MAKNDILVQFGQRVRELRHQRGYSQERLGALADLDRTYVSGIERGVRNVGLRNVAALSEALGVSLSALFEGIRDK